MPPFFDAAVADVAKTIPQEVSVARDIIHRVEVDVHEARDNSLLIKTKQAHYADSHRVDKPKVKEGEELLLCY